MLNVLLCIPSTLRASLCVCVCVHVCSAVLIGCNSVMRPRRGDCLLIDHRYHTSLYQVMFDALYDAM